MDKKALPVVSEALDTHRFSAEMVAKIAAFWLLGFSLEGLGCAGLNAVTYGLISWLFT